MLSPIYYQTVLDEKFDSFHPIYIKIWFSTVHACACCLCPHGWGWMCVLIAGEADKICWKHKMLCLHTMWHHYLWTRTEFYSQILLPNIQTHTAIKAPKTKKIPPRSTKKCHISNSNSEQTVQAWRCQRSRTGCWINVLFRHLFIRLQRNLMLSNLLVKAYQVWS